MGGGVYAVGKRMDNQQRYCCTTVHMMMRSDRNLGSGTSGLSEKTGSREQRRTPTGVWEESPAGIIEELRNFGHAVEWMKASVSSGGGGESARKISTGYCVAQLETPYTALSSKRCYTFLPGKFASRSTSYRHNRNVARTDRESERSF